MNSAEGDQVSVKSEPYVGTEVATLPDINPVGIQAKPEAVKTELEVKSETNATEEQNTTVQCSSVCGHPIAAVSQSAIDSAPKLLDCSCCVLKLPMSRFSKNQRKKSQPKCKSCTEQNKPSVKGSRGAREAAQRSEGANSVFENKVGRLKMARGALQRKRDEASKLKMTKRREEYEQQLNKEEQDIQRQEALLKRENPSVFDKLMNNLKIKKPISEKEDRKEQAKKKKAKKILKRKAEAAAGPKPKKKKNPVDSSVYVPPASAEKVPARLIPTRSQVKPQVKTEVKQELTKMEP
ncbi:hypothetical protein DVH05_004610 [Phytophthora capsici]|nr:hypothetical protein DVH05_004610 [Phytophthora capsici]